MNETFSFLLQLAAEREALILQCCYHYTHSIWLPSLPLPVPTHFVCIQWDGQVDKEGEKEVKIDVSPSQRS